MLRRVVLAAVFAAGLVSSPAFAATRYYHALLDAKSEVPPTTSTGTGKFDAALDTKTMVLTYTTV
jgi:hypothetical protein